MPSVHASLYLVTKVSPDWELSVSLSLSLLSALRGRVLYVTEEPRRTLEEVLMVSIKGRDILKWDRIRSRHFKNHYWCSLNQNHSLTVLTF